MSDSQPKELFDPDSYDIWQIALRHLRSTASYIVENKRNEIYEEAKFRIHQEIIDLQHRIDFKIKEVGELRLKLQALYDMKDGMYDVVKSKE